jgi:hypothetical protein
MAVVEDDDGGPGGSQSLGVAGETVVAGQGETVAHDDAGARPGPGGAGAVHPGGARPLARREFEIAPFAHRCPLCAVPGPEPIDRESTLLFGLRQECVRHVANLTLDVSPKTF